MLISHCCGGVKKLKNISPPFWNCVVGIHVFQTFSDDIKLNVFFFLYRFYEKSETARVAQTSRIVQPNRPLSGPSWCLLKSSFKLTPFPPAALSFFFKNESGLTDCTLVLMQDFVSFSSFSLVCEWSQHWYELADVQSKCHPSTNAIVCVCVSQCVVLFFPPKFSIIL